LLEETKIICIGCPKGCSITINHVEKDIQNIKGSGCKKGVEYAQNEFTEPTRILTSTVKVNSGELPFVPVKTESPIRKDKLFDCMREISWLEVDSPIKLGSVVKTNIGQTGVDLIATRTINRV
jgi:CxxC motif-containing protein